MREINVPGRGIYRIEYLVLDLNGTLSIDGTLIDGVAGKLLTLGRFLDIRILTADTLGKADAIASSLKIPMMKIKPESQQTQKLQYIQRLGSEATAAIGNGANDALMVKAAAFGICVLGLRGLPAKP